MSRNSILDYRLPLFEGLSEHDLAPCAPDFTERRLDAWETLIDQHTASRDVYFLVAGSLLAVYWTSEGREIIFSRQPVGEYLGELAALDDGPRSLAVVARSRATVVCMPQRSFVSLFDQVPAIRHRVTRGLVARIRSLTAKNLELTAFSVEQRVSSYLLTLALERGRLEGGGVIEDAPTHADIAASVGANREMVSRIMVRLKKRGVIDASRRRIELLDPEALSNEI